MPSDVVITRDFMLQVWGDTDQTIDEFSGVFPRERQALEKFFKEVSYCDVRSSEHFANFVRKYQMCTFRDLLDEYFQDERLKQVLSAFLGNVGLPSTRVSALRAIVMLKEFILDGGYYVTGGMHRFVDRLARNFEHWGGILKYRTKATRIETDGLGVTGIVTDREKRIGAKIVVSSGSPRQTFVSMLQTESKPWSSRLEEFCTRIERLEPSVSAMVLYLGVKRETSDQLPGRTVWYLPTYKADEVYNEVFMGNPDIEARTLLAAFPSRYDNSLAPEHYETINLFALAPFVSEAFWKSHKELIAEALIARANEFIPLLRERIVFKEVATPVTIRRYTLNDQGAMYGLSSVPLQMSSRLMPQKTIVPGLYLASHWATVGTGQGGTPMAAFAGRNAARLILKSLRVATTVVASSGHG